MADDMTLRPTRLECPLCDYAVSPVEDWVLQLHFEHVHTEDSPFKIENDPEPLPPSLPPRPSERSSKQEDDDEPSEFVEGSVLCPKADCGEYILLSDYNDHLDLHAAESLSFDKATGQYHSQQPANMAGIDSTHYANGNYKNPSFIEHNFSTALPNALRNHGDRKLKKKTPRDRGDSSGSEKSALSRSIMSFNPFAKLNKAVKPPKSTTRLGRKELGPYAWEDRMPKWLYDQLAEGPEISVVNRIGRDGRLIKQEIVQNETPGLIPILAQLSALDRSVSEAYYCHPSTLHVGKTPKEGGFCGYRNIQMLISYIQGSHAQGHEEFAGRTPGILRLQDLIEKAWGKGINEIGRQQTGGVRGTRKYIGTPEAQALFLSSEIDCSVATYTDSPGGESEAHEQLLTGIQAYFSTTTPKNEDGSNVHKTLLPPIYLQREGHSLTIVGFERHKDGTRNLMIFDPMYHPSPAMHRLLGRKNIRTFRPEVMQLYRRGSRQLRRYAAFEVLMLTAHPPLFPAWDVLRQFPDCRYLYAFFRSKTLGYDVYPEDHFLSNFPWQRYGGLWIVDNARFARAEKMNPLTAQALRRITGEGSTPASGIFSSSCGSGSSSSFITETAQQSLHTRAWQTVRGEECSRLLSSVSSLDDLQSADPGFKIDCNSFDDIFGMTGMHSAKHHVTARYNSGYPSPLSPSPNAKQWYPSPASETGNGSTIPRLNSPRSVDGSEVCGPSHLYISHTSEHYVPSSWGAGIDINNVHSLRPVNIGPCRPISPTRSMSGSTISPTSPSRSVSPRTAMLKNMFDKQSYQHLPNIHAYLSTKTPNSSPPAPLSPPFSNPSSTSIAIANGTETCLGSPVAPSALQYKSHRPVESGLLALQPLSEAQVAEYRFWRPCGKRVCAFGCGESLVGEKAAARKLFKSVEEVRENGQCCDGDGEELVVAVGIGKM